MSILNKTLKERDLLFQISHEDTEIKSIYAGFDGTAQSLQIGNLTPIAALRHLAKSGIRPIVLLGGATSKVGDPSGKNAARAQLDNDSVLSNIDRIGLQIKKLLPDAVVVNNYDWLGPLTFMDFLDQAAGYISVSSIVSLKTFAARLENHDPFSMKEMLYPLMQGYDFLWLFENMECQAQLGGQDQWCNLLTGLDLIQRKHSKNANVVAVTSPLLVDAAGNKMGKSLKGAIYLSSEFCPVYDFWSFWRNIEDSLVKTCLLRFSDFSVEEINDFVNTDINDAKIKLANFMTEWVHSKEEAVSAQNQAHSIFVDKNYDDLPLTTVSSNKLSNIVAELKNISMSEAKQLIQSNAVKLNDQVLNDIQLTLNEGGILIIGKKDVFKIAF